MLLQLIAGIAFAAVLAGALGYAVMSRVKSSSIAQRASDTRDLLRQAAYTLAVAAINADADDAREPLAGTDYTPGAATDNPSASATYPTYPAPLTNDGWYIPKASAAPKLDAWKSYIKYCVWDNGSGNSSTGRITGDATASYLSAVALTVISAGPNKMMQTTCAQARAGTTAGDDIRFTMTNAQIVQGVGGTAYLGDAVADTAALDLLSAVQPGQIRTDLSGTVYVNKTGNSGAANWTAISGGGGGAAATTIGTQPSYASITALSGPITAGKMYFARDTGALYVTRDDIPAGQSGQQYWQMVNLQPDTNPAVTISGPASYIFRTNTNYTASPATLATGSGGTGALKYSLSFDTPADASLFFPPLIFNANGTATGTGPASVISNRQARIVATDTLGRWASKAITLSVSNLLPTTYVVLTSNGTYTLPTGLLIQTVKIWAIGAGGGGAGATQENYTGGGGGAGGVVYKTVTGASLSGSISHTLGTAGTGSLGNSHGANGTATTVTFNISGTNGTMTAGGGTGGRNSAAGTGTASGGSFSSGDGGAFGGSGAFNANNAAGRGGGGIGGSNSSAAPPTPGGDGAPAIDVSGLQAALAGASYGWSGPGAGSTSTTIDASNGGDAAGVGAGAGGAGTNGGRGGNAWYGGGGGGAAGGPLSTQHWGGNGGNGMVVIQLN
ncbi:MAG: hypothetical protein JWQ00_2985 [Noviherbaspirillum sp.]|nr:hypothetical protein [Noviherbaspirillum sp.]